MNTYALSIISPQGVAFDGQAQSLIVPGEEGLLEILANHAPIVVMLKKGGVVLTQDGQKKYYAIGPGVLEVNGQHRVLLLTDHIFPATSSQNVQEQLAKVK